MKHLKWAFLLVAMIGSDSLGSEISYRSTMGHCYSIKEAYRDSVSDKIEEVRGLIANAEREGKFVTYLSVPVSSVGGGQFRFNTFIAEEIAKDLVEKFGSDLFVIDPASFNIATVGEERAGGDEYMAVWSDVIGGPDGLGASIDMVYFAGPTDVQAALELADGPIIDEIVRVALEGKHKGKIDQSGDFDRESFLRYYAIRASAAYSAGANDEWNIVQNINQHRSIYNKIAVYFDGRMVNPSDYDAATQRGNEDPCE